MCELGFQHLSLRASEGDEESSLFWEDGQTKNGHGARGVTTGVFRIF
jgi:hypothetical protein